MADITKYTAEQRRRMREQALREAEERRRNAAAAQPVVRKTAPVVTKPMAASQNKYTYPEVKESAPGMPSAVRSTPDVYRREIDMKFIADMMNSSSNRISNFSVQAPSTTGLTSNGNVNVTPSIAAVSAERNQIAANLSTITRMQSQYADSDDQEMKDLLANAYGLQMDLQRLLDSQSEYIGQFQSPEEQRLFETEQGLDSSLSGKNFADINELIAGYEADARAEADPKKKGMLLEQAKLVMEWAQQNPATRTDALLDAQSAREQDLINSTGAYARYNDAVRGTSYEATLGDNYLSDEMPSNDEIIAQIEDEWSQREAELRAEGRSEADIAMYAEAYESMKADPQLWWANRRTASEGMTTPEEMAAAQQGIEGVESPWYIKQDLDRLQLDIAGSQQADQWRVYEDEAAADAKWQQYLNAARVGVYTGDEVLGHNKRVALDFIPTKYDNMHIPPEAEAYYQYIKDEYGEDVAAQYAEYAEGAYVDPALSERMEARTEMVRDNTLDRAGGIVASRAINLLTAIPNAVDAVGTTLASWISGEPVAPGAAPWMPYTEALDTFSEKIDSSMAEDLNSMGTVNDVVKRITGKDVDVPGIGSFGWGDAYQSVVSMVDSLLAIQTTGKVGFAADIMGGAYTDAFEKGYSGDQSLIVGLTSYLTEALPEMLSIEMGGKSFKRIASLLKSRGGFTLAAIGSALGGLGANSLGEAVQEGATTAMNQGVDTLVGGAKADYNQIIQQMSRSGAIMSEEDATAAAKRQQRDNIIKDAFGGFVGSLVPGVAGAAGSLASDISTYNQFQTDVASMRKPALPTKPKASDGTSEAVKAKAEARLAGMKTAEGEQSMVVDETGTEAPVTVHGITQTGKDAMVTVSDGQTDRQVKLADVAMGSDANSEVYAYAADMATPELANVFRGRYESTQDISQVANGMQYAYDMAEQGGSIDLVRRSVLTSELTAEQLQDAYNLGMAKRTENIKSLDKAASERMQRVLGNDWHGGTVDMGDVVEASLSDKQVDDVNALRAIAGVSGYNIKLFRSAANAEGRYTQENGRYDRSTNTIWIDVNAGRNNANESMVKTAMLRTLSHETTHAIQANAPEVYARLQTAVLDVLEKQGVDIDDRIAHYMSIDSSVKTRAAALDEVVADACETMLRDSDAAQKFKEAHPEEARTLGQKILEIIKDITGAIKRAFAGEAGAKSEVSKALLKDMDAFRKVAEIWTEGALQTGEVVGRETIEISPEVQQRIENDQPVSGVDEIKNSLRYDEEYMDKAEAVNDRNGFVSKKTLREAKRARAKIRDFFRDPKNKDLLNLPEDVLGKTFLPDSSYGGTEENTTVCIRSMAAQDLMDAVSKSLGRPLTVQDTLLISQEIAGLTDRPECYYCYVATDRRAYREYLGDYLRQRDEVVKKYREGADKKTLYTEFLGGRKDTKNMKDRFDMWIKAVDKGDALITGADLASLAELFNEIQEIRGTSAAKGDTSRYKQLLDATKYAQSASWAKKMQGYAAYNSHILKWPQKKVNDLNKGYGLRMYSFSDFSPAFILENMQMVTDASVRGLNVLAYTKEIDFARIFAPSGMNINVSVFAYEQDGTIAEDGMMGTAWADAQELRSKHPNVGIVMVATNDNIMKWAVQQDWVDVVIPYHLVRTGQAVADYFGYKNYTSMSGDKKTLEFKKGSPTSISPVEHRNDIIAYVDALQRYGLSPRFAEQMQGYEQYLAGEISPQQFREMNPYYMKLVNETRRSYADTEAVQPVFDTEAAMESIDTMIKQGGYYKPIGGSKDAQNEIADDIAEKIKESGKVAGDVKFSPREGYTEDGIAVYSSNFPEGTTRPERQARILQLVQEVWSKNPIKLKILRNGREETITAKFDPYVDPEGNINSDATKLAYGNRKGSSPDQRTTEKLADDFPEIISNSEYSHTTQESGKETAAHRGVLVWHYFANRIGFINEKKNYAEYNVTVDVKEKDDGDYVYAFAAVKIKGSERPKAPTLYSAPGTINAPVNGIAPANATNSIPQPASDFNPEIQKSARDPYEVSDREILANALENATKNADEKAWLEAYKKDLGQLNEYQAVLDKNRAVVRELLFKAGRTSDESSDLAKAQERVKHYADKLAKKDKALLKIEAAAPLRAIVDREGKKVRDAMREREKGKIADIRATQENAAFRKRIVRKVKRLDELLRNPTDQKHVPDNLKAATLDMLKVFTDDTSVFDREKLERVRREYAELTNRDSDTSAAGMYDEDTAERIVLLAETIGDKRLSQLTREQLDEVMKVVDHFSHLISNANAVFVEGRRERVDTLAEEVATETQKKGIHMENRANMNALWKLLSQGQITPAYFFRRLGGAMGRLGNAILNGENRFGVNALKSRETMTGIMQKYHHKAWAGDKRDKLSFVTEEGDVISLTREQALSLYATDKRERSNRLQNASHLRTGGIIIQQGKLGLRENRQSNANATPISSADMEKINAWLTAEQKAYADAMVEYISKDMSELGNETSRALHGYSKFGEGYYFPYKTSSDFRKTNLGDSETALIKSMGFTKSVVRNANTPIIVGNFTETVSEHVAKMLMYNSFAEAQDAFMRVYDHKLTKSRSVKSMIKTAWGKNVTDYIEQFMRDVYGGVTRDKTDEFGDKWLSKFKKNAVLASASVAIQQPSALMRAMAYIDPKYFGGKPMAGGFREAMNYAGTAVIKDIGRFDTNTGRTVAEWMVAEDYQGIKERAGALITDADYRSDLFGIGPEYMDRAAWGIMWNAVKREQAAKTGLDIDSEALKEIAGRRFDEVMRYTQVYDSVMSRSEAMRSKTTYAKMLTAFMAEPTVTYNMFVDAWFDKQTTGTAKAKRVTRTMAALTGSIILNNLLKSLVAAARDDDDENETYRERYIKAFSGSIVTDITPLNYIPYAKDIMSIFQGYDVERSDTAIFNAMKEAMFTMADDSKSMYERTKSFAVFVGLATGIPFKNVWRDVEAALNTFQTVKDQRVLREGWLTNSMKYGAGSVFGVKDTKSHSTEKLLDAVLAEDASKVAMWREHMSAYNGMDEKAINSALANAIRDALEAGEVTDAKAQDLLVAFAGHDEDEAADKLNKWQYKMETGSNYTDMKERFLNGEITEEEAVQARVEYGGVSEDKARKTVSEWAFEKDNDYAYDDMEDAFKDGDVTKQQAIQARIDQGADEDDAYWAVTGWEYEKQTGNEWDGRTTKLNVAMESGKLSDIEAAMEELYSHNSWKNPSSEMTGSVTAYWKPLYIAASEAERKAMLPLIYDCYELAYTLNGEVYYGDDNVWKKRIKRWVDD